MDRILSGGHRLVCEYGGEGATGVAILIHRRWVKYIRKVHRIHDRLMAIDLKLKEKTKILHTNDTDVFNDSDFVNILGQLIEVLHDDQLHRYLGRFLSLSASDRRHIRFDHRKHQA